MVRSTPAATLDELRADPIFQYDRPVSEQPSLWDRFWQWVLRNVIAPFFQQSATPSGRALWFVLAALVLVAVILRLFRSDIGGLFRRSEKGTGDLEGPLLDVEDIQATDLRTLLRRAVEAEAYRDVVRLRYLLVLQSLAARGAIVWARDKTNRQFVSEVRFGSDAETARLFADATRVFDYVWYGGLPVDAARFASLGDRFDRLDTALSDGAAHAGRRKGVST